MSNHSSARPHTIKSTKNKTRENKRSKANSSKNNTLNLNGASKRTISTSTKNKTLSANGTSKRTISDALKRRAQSLIKNKSIDAGTRTIIRYGLAINDPGLAQLVCRVEAGEPIIDAAGRLIIETAVQGSL